MTIIDAGEFQHWISCFDQYEKAHARHAFAAKAQNPALTEYLRIELEKASRNLNAAMASVKDR